MGVAIRDILTEYKRPAEWDRLRGRAAFDGNNALYQFLTTIRQADGTPLMDNEGRVTSHLSGLFFRLTNFIEKGISPVFIFDGKPPEFKSKTISERRAVKEKAEIQRVEALKVGDIQAAFRHARSSTRVDKEIIDSSKRLLSLMGIPYLDAPSEGEAQAAFMVSEGIVDYSVSQDYDSLLFGAEKLARNLTVSRKRKIRSRTITVNPEIITLDEVLSGLDITREQLIEIGILIGTDFNSGIRGIGPKKALKIVRDNAFEKILSESVPDFDYLPVKDFFLNPPVTENIIPDYGAVDGAGVTEFLCAEHGFSEERINSVLEKINAGAGQKTLDQWF
ncbi:flap endonuclease-1 [Methanoplanus endosymbiosus]|uniref:Flap endonuclease 1 n=1 Tax=Methanoplanus endosymbiosus TaxID=33865 RepID=A0A9E7PND6_9EURY|nr:flap endonuclease-1 [Methanoplanus endosymbiosus]UUX93485.1 flap endonuclease-1 [Methanoplanus endosymbiosus]